MNYVRTQTTEANATHNTLRDSRSTTGNDRKTDSASTSEVRRTDSNLFVVCTTNRDVHLSLAISDPMPRQRETLPCLARRTLLPSARHIFWLLRKSFEHAFISRWHWGAEYICSIIIICYQKQIQTWRRGREEINVNRIVDKRAARFMSLTTYTDTLYFQLSVFCIFGSWLIFLIFILHKYYFWNDLRCREIIYIHIYLHI